MSKQKEIEAPNIPLYELIRQLELTNGNIFQLKLAVNNLIQAIETEDLKYAKSVIEIFKLKDILKNLTPEQ